MIQVLSTKVNRVELGRYATVTWEIVLSLFQLESNHTQKPVWRLVRQIHSVKKLQRLQAAFQEEHYRKYANKEGELIGIPYVRRVEANRPIILKHIRELYPDLKAPLPISLDYVRDRV